MIRNIIFDWSGTLVDDLPAVWEATNHVFVNAGLAEMELATFRREFTFPFEDFYKRFLPNVPPGQIEQWFHVRFSEVHDNVTELPHARNFLEQCEKKGIRTFLLTAVPENHLKLQAERLGFDRFLHHCFTGALDKRPIILELIKRHHLLLDETLYIGDMQHDINTARHGGVRSCAVLTGYNSPEQLRQSQPDIIAEHLGELLQLLDQNGWALPDDAGLGPLPEFPITTVGGLILNERKEALMVRTRKWSNLWGIPGGKVKYGEPSETALQRELLEETNLHVTDIQFVLVQDCIRSKEFYREAHFVLLNYLCRSLPGQVKLNDEAQEFRWVPLNACLEMELNTPTRILIEAVLNKHEF
ncbi:MAG: HAD hydrolase-like protein [Verrucomicrobiota bacterium]|nr:HAD hydrolase-like protein [Verrucomicrobiota bacterium]